jgi:hypothetical protein
MAKIKNGLVNGVFLGSLEVAFFGGVDEVILVLLVADLTVVGVGSRRFEAVCQFVRSAEVDEFEVPFNFFFELKPLEGRVLSVVLLKDKKSDTWSVGRKKAGVKKSRSWLKVGMIDFAIPWDLCHLKYTLPSLRSLLLFPPPEPLARLPSATACSLTQSQIFESSSIILIVRT